MSNDNLVREERELESFSQVVLADYGKLFLSQGDQPGLIVEADKDLLKLVSSEVRQGKLILRIDEPWMDRLARFFIDPWRGKRLVFHLTVKNLDRLELHGAAKVIGESLHMDKLSLTLSGAGEVVLKNLKGKRIKTTISGAGRVRAQGSVLDQEVRISGAGNYAAGELQSNTCLVNLSGTGLAVVWAQEELKLSISGLGKVEYFGAPHVSQRISGIGRLERLGMAPN